MKFKNLISLLSFSLFFPLMAPVETANSVENVQITNMIDWENPSLAFVGSFISQSVTVKSIPNLSDAEANFSLNIGNSSSVISPYFNFTNRNVVYFGIFEVPAGSTFTTNNSNTTCSLDGSSPFGSASMYRANCTTNLVMKIGETYTFEISRKNAAQGVSIGASVLVKSSGQFVDLGTVNFAASPDLISRSGSLFTFNQSSLYGLGLSCTSSIGMEGIYSPIKVNSGYLAATKTRPGAICPNYLPTEQGDGSYIVSFGSIAGTSFVCPVAEDLTPNESQPKVIGFIFTGTNQTFLRYVDGTKSTTSTSSPLIGCYGDLIGKGRGENLGWQYGVIGRDSSGFYWKNGAGIKWGLTLDSDGKSLTTDSRNPYLANGNKFNLIVIGTFPNSTAANKVTQPNKPVFKGFNIVGNILNLTLNIGSGTNKPDNVYLIAPSLGINTAKSGVINAGNATFAIPINNILLGSPLDLSFYSVKNGINSDNLSTTINLPASSGKTLNINKSAPLPATNAKYMVGALLVNVTAKTQSKSGANPIGGYLVASSLGITSANPIVGRISKGVVSFGIPLSPTLAGKTVSTQIYLTNEVGDSKPLNLSIRFPGVAPQVLPSQKVATVICKKGNQARTFVGTKCPPGWK